MKVATPCFAALSVLTLLRLDTLPSDPSEEDECHCAAVSQLQMCRRSNTLEDLAHLNCSLTKFNRVFKYQARTGTHSLISTGDCKCRNEKKKKSSRHRGKKMPNGSISMSQFQDTICADFTLVARGRSGGTWQGTTQIHRKHSNSRKGQNYRCNIHVVLPGRLASYIDFKGVKTSVMWLLNPLDLLSRLFPKALNHTLPSEKKQRQ